MSEDREQILRQAGLPPRLAGLLKGATEQELTDSAHEVAADLDIRPQTEAILLARKAIKHAAEYRAMLGQGNEEPTPKPKRSAATEPTPTRQEQKQAQKQALVDLFHPKGDNDG